MGRTSLAPPLSGESASWRIPRRELIAAVVVLGFANGVAETVRDQVRWEGLSAAALQTFGLSAIVFIALYVGVDFVLHGRRGPATGLDLAVAGACALGFLVPSSKVSWLVLSGFAALEYLRSPSGSVERKGALVVAAITVPMFWSKIVFAVFSGPLLQLDAILVGSLVGLPHVGNVIRLPEGQGDLWIAAGCSSLANVSLAVLWWTVSSAARLGPAAGRSLLAGVSACLAVMVINTVRIGLMAASPQHYALLHGPVGAAVAGWLTTLAILLTCAVGRD